MTSLAAVVDELYGLVPDEFTAARDAASRKARDDGDRELAAAMKALRRPSVSAWLVNQLARRYADRLDDLLDLGEALRAAQDALHGDELRALSRRRHEVVGALADLAGEAAAQSGRRVGDAVRREIEATLDAALADEQAAEAVRSGHLMRPLSSTGLEAVDLTDALAGDLPPPPRQRARKKPATKSAAATKRSQPPRAAAQREQRAVREARAALDRAEADLTSRDEAVRAAQSAVDEARGRVAALEAELAEARQRQHAAESERRDADKSRRAAVRVREAAARDLQAAERRASG